MKKIIIGLIVSLGLAGCAELERIPLTHKQANFQYDYKVPDVKKKELWQRARGYIVNIFGDSRAVLRVSDENETVLLGKALVSWDASWDIGGNTECLNYYKLRFKAKDGKARMQLVLLADGPRSIDKPLGTTGGCGPPNEDGYNQIKQEFRALNLGMRKALSQKSSLDDF